MSSRKEGNPHSVSALLASTPRSKAKKSRKRRLHTYSLVEPPERAAAGADANTATGEDDSTGTGSCVQNCVLSEFMKIADTIPDIKYRLFDMSGAYAGTLEVTPATCSVTPLGPMDVVRLVVSSTSGLCQYQVMYPVPRCVERLKRVASEDTQQILEVLSVVRDSSEYVLCPGLKPTTYEDMVKAVGFHRQAIRIFDYPTKRYESIACLLWHKPTNARTPVGHDLNNVCVSCKQEAHRTTLNAERAILVTAEEKDARRDPTSKYPISKLSPCSQSIKIERIKKDRLDFQQKLKEVVDNTSVQMDLEDSVEIGDLVTKINSNPQHLDALLNEADKRGYKDVLEAVWMEDTSRAQFLCDQLTNKTGNKTNKWSLVTYRIALAIFVRSPAAYEAVKSLNILNLPSRRSLESCAGMESHPPGVSHKYLCEQWKNYQAHCEKVQREGHPTPVSEGVLIFDEVKVQNGVCWHTKTNRIVGLCMTHEQLTTLADVYEELKEGRAEKTTYILQFLWRDISSKYDVIGPYFTSSSGLDARLTAACLYETMGAMESIGFRVKGLICDGASWNLSLVKKLCGVDGQFGRDDSESPDSEEYYRVPCSFKNPFSDRVVWIIICPSHQLKNMISALNSSKVGGTKAFCFQGNVFGWGTIEKMWQRELSRAERGLMSAVPKLRERHIHRDSWTRLNVAPAKIMQQDHVIDEIERYGVPLYPEDKATLSYLKAMRLLFERGFLCREHITTPDSPVLGRIKEGFSFLIDWYDGLLAHGVDPQDVNQTKFLAWQTWDLMRLLYFGFSGFCADFTTTYGPEHYVVPVRINGSAIESLFGRFKFDAGGNLSAINYEAALSRVMTADAIARTCTDSYRNSELNVKGDRN